MTKLAIFIMNILTYLFNSLIWFDYSKCTSFVGAFEATERKSNTEDVVYESEIGYVLRKRPSNKFYECPNERYNSAAFDTVLQCQVAVNDFHWLSRAQELNLLQTPKNTNGETSYEMNHKDADAGRLLKMMMGQIEHSMVGGAEKDIFSTVQEVYKRLVNDYL